MSVSRRILLAGLAGLSMFSLSACHSLPDRFAPNPDASTTIYLVRHAEKQTGNNPSLTLDGHARADALAELLDGADLSAIYSTDYARTLETAAPTAAAYGLITTLYAPDDLDAFARQLSAQPGQVLVVGHSNTTPQLVAALGGNPGTPIYEATEYDRIYVVSLVPNAAPDSQLLRFGKRYVPAPQAAE